MPAPNTTQVEPGSTLAVLIAAPSPVERPHANRHARSGGASGETFARAISGITVYCAKVLVPMKWRIGSAARIFTWDALLSGRWGAGGLARRRPGALVAGQPASTIRAEAKRLRKRWKREGSRTGSRERTRQRARGVAGRSAARSLPAVAL